MCELPATPIESLLKGCIGMARSVPAAINLSAFDCPHCGVYTSHFWYELFQEKITGTTPVPFVWKGSPEIGETGATNNQPNQKMSNLHIARCFHCHKYSLWVCEQMVWPASKLGTAPNIDLPGDIISDFEEARSIVELSPRGAAALMRLSLQKLCGELGASGSTLDAMIADLVSKGLNPLVQQALDAVRVVGNEAVHPGTMDLKDDRQTALSLFDLVNSVADQMISSPKNAKAVYDKLPEEKRKAIEARDRKKREPGE